MRIGLFYREAVTRLQQLLPIKRPLAIECYWLCRKIVVPEIHCPFDCRRRSIIGLRKGGGIASAQQKKTYNDPENDFHKYTPAKLLEFFFTVLKRCDPEKMI